MTTYDPCSAGRGGIDIGGGVRIKYFARRGVRAGLIESHPGRDGVRCTGVVTFDVPATADVKGRARWTVVSDEPLTLSPSLLCRTCGHHGFIREGRWVDA
jgi:hypothetical protein